MKKIVVILMSFVLLFLSACSNTNISKISDKTWNSLNETWKLTTGEKDEALDLVKDILDDNK